MRPDLFPRRTTAGAPTRASPAAMIRVSSGQWLAREAYGPWQMCHGCHRGLRYGRCRAHDRVYCLDSE